MCTHPEKYESNSYSESRAQAEEALPLAKLYIARKRCPHKPVEMDWRKERKRRAEGEFPSGERNLLFEQTNNKVQQSNIFGFCELIRGKQKNIAAHNGSKTYQPNKKVTC